LSSGGVLHEILPGIGLKLRAAAIAAEVILYALVLEDVSR
jgi:hypothetical protein